MKKYVSKKLHAPSAGTVSPAQLHNNAVSAMGEIGIDIIEQRPTLLSAEMIGNFFKILNMMRMDDNSYPLLSVQEVTDLNISDRKEKSVDDVRKIRDQIKSKVSRLKNSPGENT